MFRYAPLGPGFRTRYPKIEEVSNRVPNIHNSMIARNRDQLEGDD